MCNDEGRVERIDECVLRWFGHMKRMEKDRIPKRVYAGSRSVGRPRKRWIDIVKECLKKKGWISGKQREWCTIGMNGRDL